MGRNLPLNQSPADSAIPDYEDDLILAVLKISRRRAKIEIGNQDSKRDSNLIKTLGNYWMKDKRGRAIFSVTTTSSIAVHGQIKVWQCLEKFSGKVDQRKKRGVEESCEPLQPDPPGGKILAVSHGHRKGVAIKVRKPQVSRVGPPYVAAIGHRMAKTAAVDGSSIRHVHAPFVATVVGGCGSGIVGASLEDRGTAKDATIGSGVDAPFPAVDVGNSSIHFRFDARDAVDTADACSSTSGINILSVAAGILGGGDRMSSCPGVIGPRATMRPAPAEVGACGITETRTQDEAITPKTDRVVVPTIATVLESLPRAETTAANDTTAFKLDEPVGPLERCLANFSPINSAPQDDHRGALLSSRSPSRNASGTSASPVASLAAEMATGSLLTPFSLTTATKVTNGSTVTPSAEAGLIGLTLSKYPFSESSFREDQAGLSLRSDTEETDLNVAPLDSSAIMTAGNSLPRTVATPTSGIVVEPNEKVGPFGLRLSKCSFDPLFGKDAVKDALAPASGTTCAGFDKVATATTKEVAGFPAACIRTDDIVAKMEAEVCRVQRDTSETPHASGAQMAPAGLQPGPAFGPAGSACAFSWSGDGTDIVAKARLYSASYDRVVTETSAQERNNPLEEDIVAPEVLSTPNQDPSTMKSETLPVGALEATMTAAHLQQLFKRGLLRPSHLISNTVARMGRLDLLECATKTHGCPFDATTFAAAAGGGHLGVIWWLQAHGIPWDAKIMTEAAKGGHMPVLLAAKTQGCPWDKFTCIAAARKGHLHVLQWAREPLVYASPYFIWAITHGNPYDNLVREGEQCPWTEEVCSEAAAGGHLSLLQWARANNCPWDSKTILNARLGGHDEIVKWARVHGCIEPAEGS